MKKFLAVILILTLPVYAGGCISGGGGGGDSGGPGGGGSAALDKSDVTLVFKFGDMLAMNSAEGNVMLAKIIDLISAAKTAYAAPLYDFITSLYIKVTAADMTTIEYNKDITETSGSLSVTLTVPNGTGRVFYVELKDRNGFVLYSGNLVINVGSQQGEPQDITIDVTVDEDINADDYINIGRGYLESHKLELAFIAFDTAVAIDADHPVANFFRGFTKLLLLVQKDDTDVDAASPDVALTSALNLYTGINVYTDTIVPPDPPPGSTDPKRPSYSIVPDIYDNDEPGLEDEGYDDKLKEFFDYDWKLPTNLTTDDGVDVIKDVVLPEIENVISDLANAEKDKVFYTTLTTSMHFGIESEVKVDRADIYILQAIAYGLKAYYNNNLAYQQRTSIDYWVDKFDKDVYSGLQNIIDDSRRQSDHLGEFVGSADTYLSNAKTAYSSGLDKLKAGLQFIDKRSGVNKEGHIFNIAADDNVDIESIISSMDGIKLALNGPTSIDFDEDTAKLDLSKLFLSSDAPDINSLPEFYYHQTSDTDLPIFDTNDPEPTFDPSFGGIIVEINNKPINTIEDALRGEIIPSQYKFDVPSKTIAMTGNVGDFDGVRPVAFSKEETEDEKPDYADLTEVYMAKDTDYLYIGLKLRGTPYTSPMQSGEWFEYHLHLCAGRDNLSWYGAPLIIKLRATGTTAWQWQLRSRGEDKGIITDTNFGYAMGDIVELKIPLSYIKARIDEYESGVFPSGWDGREIFIGIDLSSDITGHGQANDSAANDCLAKLKD